MTAASIAPSARSIFIPMRSRIQKATEIQFIIAIKNTGPQL
jgi:hypothetical protein